ncbi:unnamed protein product [Boreogadus saida]
MHLPLTLPALLPHPHHPFNLPSSIAPSFAPSPIRSFPHHPSPLSQPTFTLPSSFALSPTAFDPLPPSPIPPPSLLHSLLPPLPPPQLQSFLQVNVSQVRVDECPGSDCDGASGCTTTLSVRDALTVVDCGPVGLVSVTVEAMAVCTCPGRDHSHQPCGTYPRSPCFNGGTCVDTQNGYRCQCLAQFEGPECQQNKRSFHGNGYAWFPPLAPCFESHVSLEFITEQVDGLLLYSGPLAQLLPWDQEDIMAIGCFRERSRAAFTEAGRN